MNVINSPYAVVFGSSVKCKLCNIPVKSTKVWTAHVNGKQHRECLQRLKRNGNLDNGSSVDRIRTCDSISIKKRQNIDSDEHVIAKRPKETAVPNDFFETPRKTSERTFIQSKSAEIRASTSSEQRSVTDVTIKHGEEIEQHNCHTNGPSTSTSSSALPEGFFDDKKLDAKARNVEVADKFEDEWKKFQKELVQEQHVADAIVDDEDLRIHSERELEEVQNEMGDLAKFVELEKLEVSRRIAGQVKQEVTDEQMSDESDEVLNFNELNSWRAKKF